MLLWVADVFLDRTQSAEIREEVYCNVRFLIFWFGIQTRARGEKLVKMWLGVFVL